MTSARGEPHPLRIATNDAQPEARVIEIRSPSIRREIHGVLRTAFNILFLWAALFTCERGAGAPTAGRPGGSPATPGSQLLALGQRAFADLPSPDQRIFREIQEGCSEAERLRSTTGRWPAPDVLAALGIPPFTPDPIDRAGYTWSFLQRGIYVNYVGVPAAGRDRPGFVVLIVEPEPGTAIDPRATTDEIHHKLADGTMLHVTVWIGPPPRELTSPLTSFSGEMSQIVVGTTVSG